MLSLRRPSPPRPGPPPAPESGRFESDAALHEAMSSRVQYSWDRYITFIHEILLLTGGTILVLMNGMFGDKARTDLTWSGVGIAALGSAVFGMFAGMGWRLTSQYFMDREVFGAKGDVVRYFELSGIRSVTDYENKYYSERAYWRWRRLFEISSYATIAALLLAWILGGVFVAHNA